MIVGYALWLLTSAYSTQIAVYPDLLICTTIAIDLGNALETPPAVIGKLACIPVVASESEDPAARRFGI